MLRLLSPPRRVFRLQKVSCFYFSKNKDLLRTEIRFVAKRNNEITPGIGTFVITWGATPLRLHLRVHP